MTSTWRPPNKEEHAPSLLGWVRSGLAKTKDESEFNPRMGQVNVGVSQPARRTFRIPRGVVPWLITLVVIAVLAAVIVPAISGFIQGFGDAFEKSGGGGSDQPIGFDTDTSERRAHGDGKGFNLANCVLAAQGDPEALEECNQRLIDSGGVNSQTSAPEGFEQLNKLSDCVSSAGGDVNRILECTSGQ
jgi:hypothetical protein